MNRHIVGELWYSLPKDTTSGLLKWLADWKNRYGLKWYMSSVLYSTKITRRSMPLNLRWLVMPCEIDANTIHFDDLKLGMRNNTYEQCPECLKYLIWDKIPHENIKLGREHEEFWGAPCSYDTVKGYVCPACGADISF